MRPTEGVITLLWTIRSQLVVQQILGCAFSHCCSNCSAIVHEVFKRAPSNQFSISLTHHGDYSPSFIRQPSHRARRPHHELCSSTHFCSTRPIQGEESILNRPQTLSSLPICQEARCTARNAAHSVTGLSQQEGFRACSTHAEGIHSDRFSSLF